MRQENEVLMRVNVKVTPNAKQEKVKKEGELLKVYTTAKAIDGKANESVKGILANYLNIKKRQIEVTRGLKSRNKSITIYGL